MYKIETMQQIEFIHDNAVNIGNLDRKTIFELQLPAYAYPFVHSFIHIEENEFVTKIKRNKEKRKYLQF